MKKIVLVALMLVLTVFCFACKKKPKGVREPIHDVSLEFKNGDVMRIKIIKIDNISKIHEFLIINETTGKEKLVRLNENRTDNVIGTFEDFILDIRLNIYRVSVCYSNLEWDHAIDLLDDLYVKTWLRLDDISNDYFHIDYTYFSNLNVRTTEKEYSGKIYSMKDIFSKEAYVLDNGVVKDKKGHICCTFYDRLPHYVLKPFINGSLTPPDK